MDAEQAVIEAERIIGAPYKVQTIQDIVVEAGDNPEKIYQLSGRWIVEFHKLILDYIDELRSIISEVDLGRTISDKVDSDPDEPEDPV